VIVASFQDYLPLDDFWKIVVVCLGAAVIAPVAASLVITGFEAQADAHAVGGRRTPGDLRIALGVGVLAALIVLGILALLSD
jgi:hypothetical protein